MCLQKDNIINNVPLKIKEASIVQEEKITKEFYKDYSLFKRELYRDLVKRNKVLNYPRDFSPLQNKEENVYQSSKTRDLSPLEKVKNVKLTLFKKSQKLIDRFLFIFFAEDRSLLPANSTELILERWKADFDYGDIRPLYNFFKLYFNFLDKGRQAKGGNAEIYAYNGGLFKEDALLNSLEIDSELLYKHTRKLAKYDFESQVDVNILGHIFENSLNEIESVNAEIEGADFDKQKSKRKKDGVFYTPKYITKYIVENTIGKLCDEKKIELGFKEDEYFKGRKNRQKTTITKLVTLLDDYRNWLLQLTICDPACGSGAFLNQALDFLIKEHNYIDELKTKVLGGGLQFPDIENTILENNIFGVDLNEESVEIAKLSLWLRTAQPRRKLNDLSSNIKCGNSLIDSKAIAGDKAFHWQEEFPNVFQEKNSKIFHITTSVHDSRTSARMETFKVRERRDKGKNPKPNVVYFNADDDLIITKTIATLVKKENFIILAYNICADHLHIVLRCEEEEISKIMQKVKGVTSFAHKMAMDLSPLEKEENKASPRYFSALPNKKEVEKTRDSSPLDKEKKKPLWSQKYYCKEITTKQQLNTAVDYVKSNRSKHKLKEHSSEIKQIIASFCTTLDAAFKIEYKGGFDVVIGNPPYGAKLSNVIKDYILKKYSSFKSNFDIYTSFIELASKISNKVSYCSYIIPVSWQSGDKYYHTRKFISENLKLDIGIKLPYDVFKDAFVDTGIYVFKNLDTLSYNSKVIEFGIREKFNTSLIEEGNLKILPSKYWMNLDSLKIVLNPFFYTLQPKITNDTILLNDISNSIRGILPNLNDVSATYKTEYKKFFIGYLGRYKISEKYNWVHYSDNLREKPKDYSFFQNERIIIRRLINRQFQIMASIVDEEFVNKKDIYNLKITNKNYNIYYVLALLNSKMFSFIKTKGSTTASKDDFSQLTLSDIRTIPIKIISEENQYKFEKLVISNLSLNKDFNSLTGKFQTYLQQKFSLEKLSKKLQNWHDLQFGDFIKELNKAIKAQNKLQISKGLQSLVPLTKKDEFEWLELFEENKQKAQNLQTQINQTDKEIDKMVYELYGLTADEIAIVENS